MKFRFSFVFSFPTCAVLVLLVLLVLLVIFCCGLFTVAGVIGLYPSVAPPPDGFAGVSPTVGGLRPLTVMPGNWGFPQSSNASTLLAGSVAGPVDKLPQTAV